MSEKSELFLDLRMPKLSGTEIIKSIRNDPGLYKLFIIGLSASLNGEEIAFEAGADYYVSKPFDIDQILEVINRTSVHVP